MSTTILTFLHPSRTAIRHLFQTKRTQFSGVKFDDDLFVVEARRGVWLSPFSEKVRMKVVATNSNSCKVLVWSSSCSILNLLNLGANMKNVQSLEDFISNEVYHLCSNEEIKLRRR